MRDYDRLSQEIEQLKQALAEQEAQQPDAERND
jgi:hypothetical protein